MRFSLILTTPLSCYLTGQFRLDTVGFRSLYEKERNYSYLYLIYEIRLISPMYSLSRSLLYKHGRVCHATLLMTSMLRFLSNLPKAFPSNVAYRFMFRKRAYQKPPRLSKQKEPEHWVSPHCPRQLRGG